MPHSKRVLPDITNEFAYTVIEVIAVGRGKSFKKEFRVLCETDSLDYAREINEAHRSSYIQYGKKALIQEQAYRDQIADCIHTGKPTYYNGFVQHITMGMVVAGRCIDGLYNVIGKSVRTYNDINIVTGKKDRSFYQQ